MDTEFKAFMEQNGIRHVTSADLLYPDISTKVEIQQEKQKKSHDAKKPLRSFKIGDLMAFQNGSQDLWFLSTDHSHM